MKLRKRIRRRLYGANVEIRVYEDGSSRVRVDHPSDDPGTEIAIAGLVIREVGKQLAADGIELRPSGPLIWKSDR